MKGKNIGIITFPIDKNGLIPLSNLVDVISSICQNMYLITGDEGYIHFRNDQRFKTYNITITNSPNILKRASKYLMIQLKMARAVVASRHDVSIWIFFIGGSSLIIPQIVAKICGKRTLLLLAGSEKKGAEIAYGRYSPIVKMFINFGHIFVDNIITYSKSLIHMWNLDNYRDKILIAHEHFYNFDIFTVTTILLERPPLIGYVGSLGEVKGILNFTEALVDILNNLQDFRVLIGGNGHLREIIEANLRENHLKPRVDLPGWIPHDELPGYLNRLRLLILPSYSEGLPNIMLEAMACGTPVLVTPVGAIPDIIEDGITGFIMTDNSPECIAEGVMRALNSPDLEQIAENGRRFVKENFTFDHTVALWKEVLEVN